MSNMTPLVGTTVFAVPSVLGAVVLVRGWRDRPIARSLGWMAVCLLYGGFGIGAGISLASPDLGLVVLLASFASALLCGTAAAAAHLRSWLISRRMRRMAAAQGVDVPRDRLSTVALVVAYLAGAFLTLLASIGLALAGVTWPLTYTVTPLPDMPPVPIALVLPVVFATGAVLHPIARDMRSLLRDMWSPPRN